MLFLDLIFPRALDKSLTYTCPTHLNPQVGQRVLAQLGKILTTGIIEKIHKTPVFKGRAKEINALLDPFPLLSPVYLDWVSWASHYYFHPRGEILKNILPNAFWSPNTWEKIIQKKTRFLPPEIAPDTPPILNKEQAALFEALTPCIEQKQFAPHLLWGITGSGKTEIYLHLVAQALNQGREALVLVPEIGLTPQIAGRFLARFQNQIGLFHSGLTENQKLQTWTDLILGKIRVIVGTRSSLFAPFKNLGLIIVDEEHDASYKQEDRFRYHARDLAMVRAQKEGIPILLGSATPSLESYSNALKGKYQLHQLLKRATPAPASEIHIIDWAAEKRQTQTPLNISNHLHQAITEVLAKNEQAILFINRRGFATMLYCLECRSGMPCPNCSVSLVYHKTDKLLRCHHCTYKIPVPDTCPTCHGKQTLLTGVGSQTIEAEVKTFFPSARVARMDRDTMKSRSKLEELLNNFRERKIDILIGTQMIAKGHDFPHVTLVGILGADFGMGLPDFRANERTFQLLCQVTGRAGRGEVQGKVFIQTFMPEHPLLQMSQQQDFAALAKQELTEREELGNPPFGKLILFEISCLDESKLHTFSARLSQLKLSSKKLVVLGPGPAPLGKIQKWHRQFLLLRSSHRRELVDGAQQAIEFLKKEAPKAIKWTVDVDPLSML
jgi:primosomal protein N' (replication factor Y)